VILAFSSVLYAVEPAGNIDSMPQAMWLTVVTITTVGYGDFVPLTDLGRVVTAILTLFSVLYTAMPIGIIGNAFTQIWISRDSILLMVKTRDIMVRAGYTAEDVVLVFREYAIPGEGEGEYEVQFEGFLQMIQDMKLGLPEERAIAVFESIDRDGGGSIDEQEFLRSIFPGSHRGSRKSVDEPRDDPLERQTSNSGTVSRTSARSSRASRHRSSTISQSRDSHYGSGPRTSTSSNRISNRLTGRPDMRENADPRRPSSR